MNMQCSIISLNQGSGYTQTTRSRCVLYIVRVPSVAQILEVDFSTYCYRVAIGYPTNFLRRWSFHYIHRNASSIPGVFIYSYFHRSCLIIAPNTQGEAEMWYPTLQAMIGKLYILSHFYNMYVVSQAPPVHNIFTTSFSQQCSFVNCWRARARAIIDDKCVYSHDACATWDNWLRAQRLRSAPIWIIYRCSWTHSRYPVLRHQRRGFTYKFRKGAAIWFGSKYLRPCSWQVCERTSFGVAV